MSLISILMPFRDAASTLPEAIASIQAQTFRNFELLAVNDNSQDDSLAYVEGIQDKRIRILNNPGNGLVDALNHGLQQVRSDWIARMDADDIMHPEKLQKQWQYHLEHPDLDVIATQTRLFPDDEITDGFRQYMDWQNQILTHADFINHQYVEMPLTNPTTLFRHDIVQKTGSYLKGDVPEDYEFWLRTLHAGYRCAKLPKVLFDWRESPSRYTRTAPACSRDAFDQVRAQYLAQDQRIQTDRPLVICGAGRITRKRVRLLFDYGYRPSAWIDIDPAKIGNMIDGVAIHAPEWLRESHPRKPFVLIYIASHGAREQFSLWLEQAGYRIGRDYLAVG